MDRRITIEQVTKSRDTFGEPIETWSDLVSMWAQVRPLRAQEQFKTEQDIVFADTEFRIRYRPDINHEMRVNYDGNLYDIESIIELGRREGLRLIAKAQVI